MLTLEKFKACVWGDQTCRKETKPNKLNTKKEITLLQRSCRVGGKIDRVCCEWVGHHEEIKALVQADLERDKVWQWWTKLGMAWNIDVGGLKGLTQLGRR